LQEVLSDGFNPDLAKDRIVLIGTIAPSFNDHRWRTSYGRGQGSVRSLTGLEIQAHMVSQIVSSVLDRRPLIWWLPTHMEIFWIGFWSLVGGAIAWSFKSPASILLGESIAVTILYSICWSLLVLQGAWFPSVPPAFALIITASGLVIINTFKYKTNS
jgi:CHASE2 domain-containing sensor protein